MLGGIAFLQEDRTAQEDEGACGFCETCVKSGLDSYLELPRPHDAPWFRDEEETPGFENTADVLQHRSLVSRLVEDMERKGI